MVVLNSQINFIIRNLDLSEELRVTRESTRLLIKIFIVEFHLWS